MRRIALLLYVLCVVAACGDANGPDVVPSGPPPRAEFAAPGRVLVDRCASLDCHGASHRNYRLYGFGGARLDPSHRPDGPDTTEAELDANYAATVAIEPELTRDVAAKRRRPEELTLVRKARGAEEHVGGERLRAGSPPDACVIAWLTGGTCAPDGGAP